MAVSSAGSRLGGYQYLLAQLQRVVETPTAPSSPLGQDQVIRSTPAAAPAPTSTYTVRPGDNLSAIAKRLLGDGNRWNELYQANRDQISDPNRIFPGQVLKLPGGTSPQTAPPVQPAPVAVTPPVQPPTSTPPGPAQPAPVPSQDTSLLQRFHSAVEQYKAAKLGRLTPDQLAHLGATDKKAFFNALRPAAEAAEQQYGVPAAVTLAQAALESGWGKDPVGGYNIFGIKGHGPAGTVRVPTHEYYGGRYVAISDNFAQYDSFYQAVVEHGKVFHNGYYNKALQDYQRNRDPREFARNINGVYATDPQYGRDLISIMNDYQLA
jgi:flagellum-specific peptidoglycan hydrolase FlgJ